jgi:excisionase family DNA binding protein
MSAKSKSRSVLFTGQRCTTTLDDLGQFAGEQDSQNTRAERNPAGEFVTCKEAATLLKLSEISIRRLLTQKKLRRFKVGSRTLMRQDEVLGLVRQAE